MLDPDYILRISEGAEDYAEQLHEYIIRQIVKRIAVRQKRGDGYILTASDKWRIQALQESGVLLEDIQAELARITKLQMEEIKEAMEDAGVQALNWDDKIYRAAGLSPTPLLESPYLIRIMQRNYEATLGEWRNLTRTTAEAAQNLFINTLDEIYAGVSSGAVSYTQAFLDGIEKIASDGIKIKYPSGREDTIETATLRAVRTGISQMSGQITDARMQEMDWDIILVSSHLGARVTELQDYTNHAWWQGKFYSRTGRDTRFQPYSVCGQGNVEGIHGANCRHSHGPGDGESNPFEQYDSEENRKQYEMLQRQRALERRIRKTKREVMGLGTAVESLEGEARQKTQTAYDRKAYRLQLQNKVYSEFCEVNNLRPLQERVKIARWDRHQAAKARGAAKRYEHTRKEQG